VILFSITASLISSCFSSLPLTLFLSLPSSLRVPPSLVLSPTACPCLLPPLSLSVSSYSASSFPACYLSRRNGCIVPRLEPSRGHFRRRGGEGGGVCRLVPYSPTFTKDLRRLSAFLPAPEYAIEYIVRIAQCMFKTLIPISRHPSPTLFLPCNFLFA
jgi:hypothetical protein